MISMLDLLVHPHLVVVLLHRDPHRIQVLIQKVIRQATQIAALLVHRAQVGRDPDHTHVLSHGLALALALVPAPAPDHVLLVQILVHQEVAPFHRHLDPHQERDAIKLVLQ